MGEIACEDDGLAGPCMVLWALLKTGLLLLPLKTKQQYDVVLLGTG